MQELAQPPTAPWSLVAEIRAAHRVVGANHLRGTAERHPSGFDQHRAVGEIESERGVLLDDEKAHALVAINLAERAKDFRHHQRRKAERRLVEHQQTRPHEKRARDRQHLLLAARERSRLLAAPFGKAREKAEHAIEICAHALPVGAHVCAQAQIFLDGEIDKRAPPVGHVRYTQTRDVLSRQRADRAAAKTDIAGATDESAQGPQDCRLPGAVGAEHRRDAAVLDLEIDAVQRPRRAVPGLKILRYQDGQAQFALPRYARMTSGWRLTSSGLPLAMTRPKSSAPTRSLTRMPRFMWCSTRSTETPRRSRIARISSASPSTSEWLSPPAGSSNRRSFGPLASARASSTRLRIPNDRSPAGRSATALRPNSSISASACSTIVFSSRLASGAASELLKNPPRAIACAPTHTFSRTVMVENRATFWNVRAMPREASSCLAQLASGRPSNTIAPASGS